MEHTLAHGEALPGAAPSESAAPLTCGPYRLVRPLGEGGMGAVWLAEQTAPVRRQVALKLIKPGLDSRRVVARFEAERQALALMEHPAIARVLDGGSTAEGRPFFVMEYVAGDPLTVHCDRAGLAVRARLALFVQVCEGVQHAHQKAVIHRDLKPTNVLVAMVEAKALPRIIDFGVAKALGQRLADGALSTEVGALLGTPEYMSPEQAGGGDDVDTRADVYSLGVMLYELLTGALPFSSRELRSGSLDELRRRIREEEPPAPSAQVAALLRGARPGADAPTPPDTLPRATLARELKGDLDAIVLKAMEKDRRRRYQSAGELAADVGRYLRSEPVLARRAGSGYRLRKYLQRHRLGATVAAVAALLLPAFTASLAIQVRRVARERDRATREGEASRRLAEFLTGMFRISDPGEARGSSVTAREILDRASADVDTALTKDPELQARMMDTMGTVYFRLGLLAKAQPLLERALETRRRLLGREHPDTLETAYGLATVLWQRGLYATAEPLMRETLAARRRVLGPENAKTLESINGLGLLLKDTQRPEAEAVLREALALRLKVSGPEAPATLNVMHNLGATLQEQHRLDEAEKVQREALEISRRVLGPDHPGSLIGLTNLANTLSAEKRFAEAEALQREALERKRRVLGPEHPNTLNAMASFSDILAGEGKLAEAEKLQRETLEVRRRVIGPDHPYTSLSRYSLARYALRTGRREEALSWLREAMDHGLDTAHAQHLGEVEELAALRGEPRFATLVAEGKQRGTQAPGP